MAFTTSSISDSSLWYRAISCGVIEVVVSICWSNSLCLSHIDCNRASMAGVMDGKLDRVADCEGCDCGDEARKRRAVGASGDDLVGAVERASIDLRGVEWSLV